MRRSSSPNVIPFRVAPQVGLSLPLQASPDRKIAQISAFPEFAAARPFGRECWSSLQAFEPNVLIGYGLDLHSLCAKVGRGEITLTSVDHAVFALTDCGSAPIGETLRIALWQVFGVPVYELIIAPGCRLLAAECEAHDGWHIADGAFPYLSRGEIVFDTVRIKNVHTGLGGEIDPAPCECGRKSVRLKNLAPRLPGFYEYPLAATA